MAIRETYCADSAMCNSLLGERQTEPKCAGGARFYIAWRAS